ncbi:hypothetical protein OG393_24725 [Streptomyces sp. NBC_01216]|uniref:hypothetical protein n=1 Tax=Streptomyces sp. NBC_01216 TaxID=2903778 RepID=UPI002E11E271|nr:hypothetical protein OG393_24725 [Streptomyces sp. NBC_01216]
MGWTVLYIAFGIVALWLLGEVLLQYKARLRWRLLAFSGFLAVVVGVLLPSVAVIIAGAVTFAVGQAYVTLSFRRGFSTGWALGGSPGASRRRRSGPPAARPNLEVTDLSYEPVDPAPDGTDVVHEPEPLPEDTGSYGVYDTSYESSYDTSYESAGGREQPEETRPGYDTGHDAYAAGYDPSAQQRPGYDYGTGQHYAAYSDPYIGPGTDGQQYASYDYGTGAQQPYDPYSASYSYDTPPGGVWVPQQRDDEQSARQEWGHGGHDPHESDPHHRY